MKKYYKLMEIEFDLISQRVIDVCPVSETIYSEEEVKKYSNNTVFSSLSIDKGIFILTRNEAIQRMKELGVIEYVYAEEIKRSEVLELIFNRIRGAVVSENEILFYDSIIELDNLFTEYIDLRKKEKNEEV